MLRNHNSEPVIGLIFVDMLLGLSIAGLTMTALLVAVITGAPARRLPQIATQRPSDGLAPPGDP